VTGPGKFIRKTTLKLEDGKGAFFIQSNLGEIGVVKCHAISEGLEEATVDISVEGMKDKVVPSVPKSPSSEPEPGENVALNKPVFSDSNQFGKGNAAFMVNDGDENTRWCANDNKPNHWITIDLGKSTNISSTEVVWENNKVYKYIIEVSQDGNDWTTVVDKKNNMSSSKAQRDEFDAINARYVKIEITGLELSTWASIREFKVFADAGS